MSAPVPHTDRDGIRIRGHVSDEELAAVIVVCGQAGASSATQADPLSQWRADRQAAVRRSTPVRL